MTSENAAAVTRMLAERTGTDPHDWFLVLKARYGMQVVLEALRDERGPGEVVSQVFTCSTAVDPILVAGLRPVYAEVSAATISIDPDLLEVGPATRAVVLQHTFGIVDAAAARRVQAAAQAAGALLVEDAAHCVGRVARGGDGMPLADVSIHSFGVEKVLPTTFGGAVWVNPAMRDAGLRARIVRELAGLPPVGRRLDLALRLYRTELRILSRIPDALSVRLREGLTRAGLFEPAIAAVESRGGLGHPPMAPSAWTVGRMADALPSLDAEESRRSAVVAEYLRVLAGAVEMPGAALAGGPLVRFPLFAPDADSAERVIGALAVAGVYVGRWYRPALFPGVEDPAVYGYVPGDDGLTVSEDLVARVVNLPTIVDLPTARRAAQVVLAAIG